MPILENLLTVGVGHRNLAGRKRSLIGFERCDPNLVNQILNCKNGVRSIPIGNFADTVGKRRHQDSKYMAQIWY